MSEPKALDRNWGPENGCRRQGGFGWGSVSRQRSTAGGREKEVESKKAEVLNGDGDGDGDRRRPGRRDMEIGTVDEFPL